MTRDFREVFDPQRFARTLRFEVMSNSGRFVYFLAALLGLFAVGCLLDLLRRNGMGAWPNFLSFLAVLFGLFATSEIFGNEHHPARAPFTLLIPASLAERFLAKITLSLLLYPLIFVTGVVLVGNLFEGIAVLLGIEPFTPVWPEPQFGLVVWGYCFGHAAFLAGAVFFRRGVIGKTVLSGAFYLAVCSILFAVVGTAWAADAGLFQVLLGSVVQGGMPMNVHWEQSSSLAASAVLFATRIIALATLYVAAWFKFQEIEVR